jgi:hypothetical protein
MAVMVSGVAFAATDSGVATATVTIDEIVSVDLTWQTTGTSHIDLGPYPPDLSPGPTEILVMDVTHNLVGNPQYSVEANVVQPTGPEWFGAIMIALGPEWLTWYRTDFGTPQTFSSYVGEVGPFSELLPVDFVLDSRLTNDTYGFEFTITLTSI